MTDTRSPERFHESAVATSGAELARADASSRRVGRLRLLVVALAIGAWALHERGTPLPLATVLGLLGLAFVTLVWWHRRIESGRDALRRRIGAARAGLARARYRWQEMAAPAQLEPADGWPAVVSRDLGITGGQSLLRLVDVCHPALGGRRLLDWMLGDPAPLAQVVARQASVADLGARPALLLAVAAEARRGGTAPSEAGVQAFGRWCEAGGSAAMPTWTAPAAVVSAVVTLAAIAAYATGVAPSALGAAIAFNVALTVAARRELRRRMHGLEGALVQIGGALDVLRVVVSAEVVAGRFGEIQQRLADEGAPRAFASLVRLLEWDAVRHSPLAHWLLNAFVGFDAHLAVALGRWHRAHAERAPAWLDAVADAEALVGFGALAFEHPSWTLPTLADAPATTWLTAAELTHPLLDSRVAVPNDATLGAPGDVIVVSGPNMAGKTTWLRAVGLNVLLAQAGGPVSARGFHVARCRVRTSVRVEDDLSQGISLFLAEVRRLRDVIADAARADAPPVLFLLDEVLHGTNARDRRLATRAVLAALGRVGAVGLVTTHDPEVAPPSARHLHFDGWVERDASGAVALRFDYRAKPGPAHQANALAVLEMLGIRPGD